MFGWLKKRGKSNGPAVRDLVQKGDLEALRAMKAAGADVLAEDDPAELTALQIAASIGDVALVPWLLSPEVGADARARRNNRFTALHAAAMHGFVDVVRMLLEAGAEIDAQTDPQRYAPLHSAAFGGHREVVQLLLSRGASPHLRNYRDETPDATARRQGHLELSEQLEHARADAPDPDASPAVTAFSWGRIEVDGGRRFKDARLFPGGAEEWDWNRHGTRHRPGTQPADVRDLLELAPGLIILSRGVDLVLQTCPETLELLRDRHIPVQVLQSEEAVRLYNESRRRERVVALIHSTC